MKEYNAGTSAAIYPGDAVLMRVDGKAAIATAGNTFLVGMALSYKSATYNTVLVSDHPDQQYYIQDDGAAGTPAQTTIGTNADILATTGNATFLKSQHELDISTATTATAQLRIIGKDPDVAFGKNIPLIVKISEHWLAGKSRVGV
jgi:hypothetical protein